MYKRKSFFVTFEGIEGSGKTYLSKKLFKKIKSMRLPAIYTREPGGTGPAEKIRKVILDDYFHPDSKEKFDKYTDTLLYLASRNEHVVNKIKPAIRKRQIVICDRFIDSTLAYQVYGKSVNKNLINVVHKIILGTLKPDITFILKLNINKALKRIKKRKSSNRYDKYPKKFYQKVQNAFIKIAKTNKKRYIVLDTTKDTTKTESIIFEKVRKKLNKCKNRQRQY